MARDDLEIGVAAEQLDVVTYRDHRNEAIDETPRRLSLTATHSVELGRGLVVRRTVDAEEVLTVEQTPKPIAVRVIPCTGQDLHRDHVGPGHLLVALQNGSQASMR